MDKFKYLHWEFYMDGNDIAVYEMRSGDTIGYLQSYAGNIEELQKKLEGCTEQEVYDFIDDNIDYI